MQKNKQNIIAILKLAILLLIIIGIPLMIYFAFPDFIKMILNRERLNSFLEEYKIAGMIVYLALQIIQTVVSIIPGQVVQITAGYAFGVVFGALLSLTGIAIGTVIAFKLSGLLGRDAMHIIFGEERIGRFIKTLDSERAYLVIFLLYLIPGLPKDVVTYAAGISEIKLRKFLFISMSGRFPAMLISISVGKMLRTGNYLWIWIICILTAVLCILILCYRKRIMARISRL